MRYLVTGGCGFIGSHLADLLVGQGHDVIALDNLSTGRFENVAELESNDRFRMVVGNVKDDDLVLELIHQVDAVFHLASAVGVKLIMERPVETIDTIYQGTECVLRHANRYHKPVLITSTSEVYGKSDDVPFREDGDRLAGPTSKHRWAYACVKALDEFLALAYWKESRLPVVIARLFNTVGPRQTGRYGMVIPNFVNSALEDRPLMVHGDGQQKRCFCHVLDVVEALIALMNCPSARGSVVNVGSDEEVTIRELAERVLQRAGKQGEIRAVPYESVYGEGFEDMLRRVPSIERVETLVGWRPNRSLDQILDDVVREMRGD